MARRDTDEFAAFVAASQPALRRTAYLLCGDWHLASDHVQEALMRVYHRWPKLKREDRLHAYARRAVVSAVIDAMRKRSSSEIVLERSPETRHVVDRADVSADRDLLMHCLAQLPPRQRACVVLRYYEDMSVTDVAAALNCSEGTVKSQTARGLAALQEIYAAECGEELAVSERSSR